MATWGARMASGVIVSTTLMILTGVRISVQHAAILLLSVVYICTFQHLFPDQTPSISAPRLTRQEDGITQMMNELDEVEKLLESYAEWVERTATVCLEAYRKIYKEQKDHLGQYNNFRNQYSDQVGFIVKILEGHRKEIAQASQAATGNNISLCNVIAQYRQMVEDSQKLVRNHIDSVTTTLKGQDKAIGAAREFVEGRCDSVQNTLYAHTRQIEHNKTLIQKHGTSIDNVVSDHQELVAEYQVTLDGLALLTTANRVFSLIHKPCGWESLGDCPQQVDGNFLLEYDQGRPAEEHEKAIKLPGSDSVPPDVVSNVLELSRMFRRPSNAAAKAKPDTSSGMDQMMATVFSQLKGAAQTAVEEQHAEEVKQLRKAQEDIEKLRAEIGDMQYVRKIGQMGIEIQELAEEVRQLREDREAPQHLHDCKRSQ